MPGFHTRDECHTAEMLEALEAMEEGWEASHGARQEKQEAERLGLPVYTSREALLTARHGARS